VCGDGREMGSGDGAGVVKVRTPSYDLGSQFSISWAHPARLLSSAEPREQSLINLPWKPIHHAKVSSVSKFW